MMLSVLIVNYNVRYFLEYCLLSVMASARHMQLANADWETEVLVIDNASIDGSVEALAAVFPTVTFIRAGENLGFGGANNRLVRVARGKYTLFLNPDTIVPETCFDEHVRFMETREDLGASGIRMIDGSGRFLPESKRGFPGTWNSFCKMSGLAAFFPRSRFFAGYYVGDIPDNQSAFVPILSGAYMLVRSGVLRKTGGFDERFFMYAEDIDLSYRINLAGYRTYYFAERTIIHFKGESTSKDATYVTRFYTAMIQFVQKHFTGSAYFYIALLKLMIRVKSMTVRTSTKQPQYQEPFNKTLVLKGDPGEARRVLLRFADQVLVDIENGSGRYLLTNDNQLTGNSAPAELPGAENLYCLGEQYRFSDLITTLERVSVGGIKIFHPDATAIIGSDKKATKGTVVRPLS